MIHLNVPFIEKDHAKSLGARWDPLKKAWYVPAGVELTLFSRWLPSDFELTAEESSISENLVSEQLSLANYLVQISAIVNSACMLPVWVVAEISELRIHNGIAYLSLVEHDEKGSLIARSNARIWQNKSAQIIAKFKASTGVELTAGIKVLLQLTGNFHQSHGFALIVEDIDPSYTLGDMAAKIAQIREQLQSEKIYALNKFLTKPVDFCHVAVIAPQNAAGLGDFNREAQLLAKYNLCIFDYYHALFQGAMAPASIAEQLYTIINSGVSYDAVVIIRGGGAIADLAWLNDLALARAICNCQLPVMVGIGHERDFTILDEIACEKFDTPSKVAARIFSTVTNNALAGAQAFKEILQQAKQQVGHADLQSNELERHIRHSVTNILKLYTEKVHNTYYTMQNASITIVDKQTAKIAEFMQQVLLLAQSASKEQLSKAQDLLVQICLLIDSDLKQAELTLGSLMSLILLQEPQNILKRGYALVKSGNKIISSKVQALEHTQLTIAFKDGPINVEIK